MNRLLFSVDVEGLLEKIVEEVQGFDGTHRGSLKMKGMILKDLPRFVDRAKLRGI
jgi:hypothetical protein